MEQVDWAARDRPALYRKCGLGTRAETMVGPLRQACRSVDAPPVLGPELHSAHVPTGDTNDEAGTDGRPVVSSARAALNRRRPVTPKPRLAQPALPAISVHL